MRRSQLRARFDAGWKLALRSFLPECLLLLFPALYAQIDWARGVEFLNTELFSPVPAGKAGQMYVDVLVRVYFRDGTSRVVLLHIEIQAQRTEDFQLRVFVYHARVFDAFGYPDLISLAILADDDPNWRPDTFQRSLGGCELTFRYPVVKLLDFDEAELEQSDNPSALIVLAHLRALKTRRNPELMMREKIELLRKLNQRGYNPQQVVDLYRVVDYIMTLSKMRDELVREIIREKEAESEFPLTSFEELALEQGVEEGLRRALRELRRLVVRILRERFGAEATRMRPALARINDFDRIQSLIVDAATVSSLEEFEQKLKPPQP